MADDAFGLKSPNNPKAYTPPPGLEAVHREGNTWAIQGDRTENTSHIEVNQWNYMIALWRGLTFVEGVDLSDLNSGDPMLLKEIVVRSIDAVGGPYLTGAAAAASTATTKAGEASDSADIAVGAAGTATTKAGEAAGSADTAVGAAGTATTKAAEALASANAVSVARVAVETARDATLAAFDQFDDRMLGDFAAPPATDNDGDPLQRGALYFDTTMEIMRVWTGSVWGAAYVSSEGVLMAANNLSDIAEEAIARANIGLGNVDNTADVDKPISTAQDSAFLRKNGTSDLVITKNAPFMVLLDDGGASLRCYADGDYSNLVGSSLGDGLAKFRFMSTGSRDIASLTVLKGGVHQIVRDAVNTPDGSVALAEAGTDALLRVWSATALKAVVLAHAPAQEITAWVNFTGTGSVSINDGLNVSSITDNGTGLYRINFATPMANANYAIVGTVLDASNSTFVIVRSQTVSSFSIEILSRGSATEDAPRVMLQVCGGK